MRMWYTHTQTHTGAGFVPGTGAGALALGLGRWLGGAKAKASYGRCQPWRRRPLLFLVVRYSKKTGIGVNGAWQMANGGISNCYLLSATLVK